MHNRDMTWSTSDGRTMKLRDITTSHLLNIVVFIEKKKEQYNSIYGKERMKEVKYNILQEIRLRKLNRIESNNNELF